MQNAKMQNEGSLRSGIIRFNGDEEKTFCPPSSKIKPLYLHLLSTLLLFYKTYLTQV